MAVPTITALPEAPQVSDNKETFNAKAFPFVGALGLMGAEMNALAEWMQALVASATSVSSEVTATSYNVDAINNSNYLYFTSTSAKTVNVRANSTHALPDDYELNIRNAAASDLTIAPAGGVTVTPPADGTLVVPPNGTVTIKRVGVDSFHLMGQVNQA